MMIKTYVVNLEKDVIKRERMTEILSKLPHLDVVFFKAVEGRKLNPTELEHLADMAEFKKRYGHQATLPALGCSLSHLEIYKIIRKPSDPVLVLEDDATPAENFTTKLKPVYEWLSKQSEPIVILLSPCFSYNKYKRCSFSSETSKIVNVLHGQMTSGYLINPAAADLLAVKLQPVRYLADDWDYMKRWGLKIMGVVPNLTDCPKELGEIGLSQVSPNAPDKTHLYKLKSILSFRIRHLLGMRYSNRAW